MPPCLSATHAQRRATAAFARVAVRTGLRLRSGTTPYSDQTLADAQVLVIANALNAVNDANVLRWLGTSERAGTPWLLALEHQRDGSVVHEVHVHHGAELPRGDREAEGAQLRDE